MHADEPDRGSVGLVAGHLLFEDGRDQRFDDGQGPRDADARVAPGESCDQRMTARDRRGVIVQAEEGRDVGQRPVRTRSPCFGPELVTGVDEGHAGRPIGRSGSHARHVPSRGGSWGRMGRASAVRGSAGDRADTGSGTCGRPCGHDRDRDRVSPRAATKLPKAPEPCYGPGETCDPEMSSRAWRSSPCSSWSRFPVRSVRGSPAPMPLRTPVSSIESRPRRSPGERR